MVYTPVLLFEIYRILRGNISPLPVKELLILFFITELFKCAKLTFRNSSHSSNNILISGKEDRPIDITTNSVKIFRIKRK